MKLLTVQEVAKKLRVSERTVLRLIETGKFPNAFKTTPSRTGAPWRIPEQDLTAHIQKTKPNTD